MRICGICVSPFGANLLTLWNLFCNFATLWDTGNLK